MALRFAFRSATWGLLVLATTPNLAVATQATQRQSPKPGKSQNGENSKKDSAHSGAVISDEAEIKPADSDRERPQPKEVVDPRSKLRVIKQIAQGGESKTGPVRPSLGGGMLGLLLSSRGLQKELKLTDDQASRIAGLSAQTIEFRQNIKKEMKERKKLMRGSGVEYNKAPKVDAYASMHQENESALHRILKPKQRERLEQIRLRILGPSALADPKVATNVGLSTDQHSQIVLIVEQARLAETNLLQNVNDPLAKEPVARDNKEAATKLVTTPEGGSPLQRKMKKLEDDLERLAKKTDDQIAKLLQARQRKSFNSLLGQTIDLTTLVEPTPAPKKKTESQTNVTDSEAMPNGR